MKQIELYNDFQRFEAIRSLYCTTNIDESETNRSSLLENMAEFLEKTRPKNKKT